MCVIPNAAGRNPRPRATFNSQWPPEADGVSRRDIVTPGGLEKPAEPSFYFKSSIFLVFVYVLSVSR